MGQRDNKKSWPIWLGAMVIVAVVASAGGYYASKQGEPKEPATDEGNKQAETPPTGAQTPTPEPTPTPTPTPSPNEPSGQAPAQDAITFSAYTGSGSIDLRDRKLENDAFKIKSIDWSDASRTLYLQVDMRAFEGVAYFRVKDDAGVLLEPESVLRATEGAPAWSPVQAEIPLIPDYQGKQLVVEFYAKSAKDGSRVNMLKLKLHPQ